MFGIPEEVYVQSYSVNRGCLGIEYAIEGPRHMIGRKCPAQHRTSTQYNLGYVSASWTFASNQPRLLVPRPG